VCARHMRLRTRLRLRSATRYATTNQLRAVKAKELATATGFSLEKCTAALRYVLPSKNELFTC
jgi:hypothetical protein